MIRKIIRIDESKCNGCGACAAACHEGAIQMVDGVARLTREDYCDGLGDCLPACPTGAISFEEREAPAYDEAAVKAAQAAKAAQSGGELPCGCPGSAAASEPPPSHPRPMSVPPAQPPHSPYGRPEACDAEKLPNRTRTIRLFPRSGMPIAAARRNQQIVILSW